MIENNKAKFKNGNIINYNAVILQLNQTVCTNLVQTAVHRARMLKPMWYECSCRKEIGEQVAQDRLISVIHESKYKIR